MDSQTKRTLLATLLCMIVVFGWIEIQQRIYPAPARVDDPAATQPAAGAAASTANVGSGPAELKPDTSSAADLVAVGGESTEDIELGDDHQNGPKSRDTNPYKLKLVLDPRGAAVKTVTLADHRSRVAKNPKEPDHDPYVLLRPVEDVKSGRMLRSFETLAVQLGAGQPRFELADKLWDATSSIDEKGNHIATFKQVLTRDGRPQLEIRKTFKVAKDSYLVDLQYEFVNHADQAVSIILTETGPIGIERADIRYDHPRAMIATVDASGRKRVGENVIRTDVLKEPGAVARLSPGESQVLWSAVSNKYFTCIVDPVPEVPGKQPWAEFVDRVSAVARINSELADLDLSLEQVYAPKQAVAPGASRNLSLSLFFGPKADKLLEKTRPDRRYDLTRAADSSICTLDIITRLMTSLLVWLHSVFGNWGIAIIVLVIIVRLVLHPITRNGQIHMMKMQKNMAKLKPKLEAIQQQHKNDRQKLNEETMKLYKTEGINPAGSILGCLPMFLQMPIWVALYTALNTNVVLRHAPFFGYIRDLSSPDAIIEFGTSVNLPLLSWMMGPVQALNILPIVMALVMYGQQKYMQKLTRPEKPPEPKFDKDGRPLPDQMAQQQKIMNFMMIFMGLIFYNMPSGLCLYILCSSLLGMGEQLYIRKHIKDKDAVMEAKAGAPKKPGFLMRKFAELQKTVEQARMAQEGRQGRPRNGRRPR